MAVTLVGVPKSNHGTGTAISVADPGGSVGDRTFFHMFVNNAPGVNDNNGGTPAVDDGDIAAGTAIFAFFQRIRTGGEPATWNFTAGSSQRWGLGAYSVAGQGAAAYEQSLVVGNTYTSGTIDDIVCPAGTTVLPGALAIAIAGIDSSTAQFDGFPAGWTEVVRWNGPGDQPVAIYYKAMPSPGTTGSATFSKTSNTEAAATMTIFSIPPAPAGVGIRVGNRLVNGGLIGGRMVR